MEFNYKIIIEKIKVDVRYYYITFKLYKNNILIKEGEYDNDHSWGVDLKSFKQMLKKGLAAKIILETYLRYL